MDLIFGIGEPRDQRVDFIRDLGKRYASDPLLQDLRLVPFHPLPETKFHDQPPMDFDAVSNLIFSLKESFPSHPISIPTHLFSRYPELFSYGLNDLGSLPDSTQDPIMPAFPVPSFAAVKTRLLERNIFLFERLSVLTAAGIQRRAIAVAVNACHRRLKRRDTQSLDFIDNHQCFVCGTQNSNGLKLSFTKHSKDTCISEWIGDPRFQGYAGILHGGLVATLVDEAMAHCLISAGMRVVTAEISVRYLQPTPLGVSLTILGTVIESKRRIHLTKGSVRLSDGTILAEAEGKYSEY
ncbi:hotdog fold thioesterase [bacterium]|nr:hotdog fold thioesterase [bacterium]